MARFQSGKRVLGIEISTNLIRMAQIRTDKTPQLEKLAITETDVGGLLDDSGGLLHPALLHDTLAAMMAEHGMTAHRVHLSIPSRYVAVRQLTLPNVPDKELQSVIEFELTDSIHLPFENPVFDFVRVPSRKQNPVVQQDGLEDALQPSLAERETAAASKMGQGWTQDNAGTHSTPASPLGREVPGHKPPSEQTFSDEEAFKILLKPSSSANSRGRFGRVGHGKGVKKQLKNQSKATTEVILIAAPRALVDSYVDVASALKLKVISVDIPALATWRVLQTQAHVDDSTVVVEITPHQVNIDLFYEGLLRLNRIIPIDLVKFSQSSATPSPSMTGGSLHDLDTSALGGELVAEINRTIHFLRYTLQHRDVSVSEVVLVGGPKETEDLAIEVQNQLALPVRRITWRGLPMAQHLGEEIANEKNREGDEFTAAIGLAMRGVRQR